MIRRFLYSSISKLLVNRGWQIVSINEQNPYLGQYKALIEEMEGCFSELVFPELPPCDGRIELIAKLIGTQVGEAMYILEFLHKSLKLEGDVCEFGVAQGATSALLANEIRTTQKNLWLFDSFKGLPKPTEKDLLINDIFNLGSIEGYEGTMGCSIDEVKSRLKEISFPFSRVRVIPGFIEDTIECAELPNKVCFAYVDFDFYNPTLIALKFLDRHLSSGGIAIVDDYGFFSSGVKTAVNQIMQEQPGRFEMSLPYKFSGHFCILRKG
jgi:O-methyltransferase